MTKLCPKCGETKDLSDFYVYRGKPRCWCKKCVLEDNKKRFVERQYSYNYKNKYHYNYSYDQKCKVRFGGLKKTILERDNYTCQHCGMTSQEHFDKWNREITVHHIDGNGRYVYEKNNDLNNMITLCLRCHGKEDYKLKGTRVSLKGIIS